jgi:hypothetical protein
MRALGSKVGSIVFLTLLAGPLGSSAVAGDEILEEIIEQNYPLDPNAKFSLKNQDGSIRIYGHALPEMKLQAIKKAYTKDRLNKIDVSVAVQAGNVSIKTNYPPKPKWGLFDRSGTVDYVIVLPWSCDLQQVELDNGELLIDGMRGSEVRARLGNGRLFGHNCFSDVQLSVAHGDLAVGYDWWENHAIGLDTTIGDGDAHVYIPSDAQFRLHAEGSDGIYNDFSRQEDRTSGEQFKLDLSIGTDPNGNLKVRALDGSVKIQELYP